MSPGLQPVETQSLSWRMAQCRSSPVVTWIATHGTRWSFPYFYVWTSSNFRDTRILWLLQNLVSPGQANTRGCAGTERIHIPRVRNCPDLTTWPLWTENRVINRTEIKTYIKKNQTHVRNYKQPKDPTSDYSNPDTKGMQRKQKRIHNIKVPPYV